MLRAISQSGGADTPPGANGEVIGKDGKKYPAEKRRKKKKEKPKPPEAPPVSIFTGTDKGEEKAKFHPRAGGRIGSRLLRNVKVARFTHARAGDL